MDGDYWDLFWETRLHSMENQGKQAAIQAASRLIRNLSQQMDHPIRLLELGCGEGQVIGELMKAHSQLVDRNASLGVDYNPTSLARCRKDYPGLHVHEADIKDPAFLNGIGQYEIIILVNVLHEVFSSEFSPELGEVDIHSGKRQVELALQRVAACIAPGGWLVLFDGLEPAAELFRLIQIHFVDPHLRANFEIFARQYQPFHISFKQLNDPLDLELSLRDFTRYITKSIFLGKPLWQTERLESYQYFTEKEFRSAFDRSGLTIHDLQTLTMNEDKWQSNVEILTPNVDFPVEHILILAQPEPAAAY